MSGVDPELEHDDATWPAAAGPGRVVERAAATPARRATFVLAGLLGLAVLVALLPLGGGGDGADDVASGTPVTYEVRSGQTVRAVGDELMEIGVIDSTLRFRRVAEEVGLAAEFLQHQHFVGTVADVRRSQAVNQHAQAAFFEKARECHHRFGDVGSLEFADQCYGGEGGWHVGC
jgi:hypothetical protein